MIAQIIAGFVLAALFFYLIRTFPPEKEIRNIILVAFIVVISTILSFLSIMIPLFGFPSIRIGFAQLALVLGGAILSPTWAFIAGFSADIVGVMIAPSGPPFLGFTLNSVLACVIPALWFRKKSKLSERTLMSLVVGVLILLGALALSYVWMVQDVAIKDDVIIMSTSLKSALSLLIVILIASMLFALFMIKKKLSNERSHGFAFWILCVIMIEVGINFALTPIWMDTMYGIPWIMSLFVRVLKSCVVIPLNAFIGFSVLNVITSLPMVSRKG